MEEQEESGDEDKNDDGDEGRPKPPRVMKVRNHCVYVQWSFEEFAMC